MCSIANPFDTNIIKLDAKKRIFLLRKHEGKSIFFKNNISVLEVEL